VCAAEAISEDAKENKTAVSRFLCTCTHTSTNMQHHINTPSTHDLSSNYLISLSLSHSLSDTRKNTRHAPTRAFMHRNTAPSDMAGAKVFAKCCDTRVAAHSRCLSLDNSAARHTAKLAERHAWHALLHSMSLLLRLQRDSAHTLRGGAHAEKNMLREAGHEIERNLHISARACQMEQGSGAHRAAQVVQGDDNSTVLLSMDDLGAGVYMGNFVSCSVILRSGC